MSFHGLMAHFFLDSPLDVSLFIHPPIEGCAGCFYVLANLNQAAINIHMQASGRPKF
jgi:hypothetical protein